ncbi:hypothetical protein BD410DRAFT_404608 [Rickenella mellea]|uniref:Uncharacterized protein n=1 Tax=Rickenella mellea TaxID=50990 RepID=A0A4Y7PXL8_9AGAM|nr:hypothetical protein BD410DRAFT_404608 [Rickenella mellea]
MDFELYLQQFRTYSSMMSKAVQQFRWPKQVDFMTRFFWEPPQSVEYLCSMLRLFREEWAAQFLSYIYEQRSRIDRRSQFLQIMLNSLCNGATHLPCSPQSTRESQIHMFWLMDHLYKRPLPPDELHTPLERLESAFLVYWTVLYGRWHGGAFPYQTPMSRRELHTDFLGHVSVHKSLQPSSEDLGADVQIPFHQYCEIITDLSSSLLNGDADLEIDQLCDLSTVAILKLIRCRYRDWQSLWAIGGPKSGGQIIVSDKHLAAARVIRSWSLRMPLALPYGRWAELVDDTAASLGYQDMLEENYNIDVHAELQYYDLYPEGNTSFPEEWEHPAASVFSNDVMGW